MLNNIGKMLTYWKIRKIKLEFLFINKFCTPVVLLLCKSLLFTKIIVMVTCYGYRVFANQKKLLINVFQNRKSQLQIHKNGFILTKKGKDL